MTTGGNGRGMFARVTDVERSLARMRWILVALALVCVLLVIFSGVLYMGVA